MLHSVTALMGGNRSGGEAPPADVLSRHAGAMRPVIMEDGKPYLWLRHVLRALPTATTVEHFEALLPWNLNAEQLITA